MFPLTSALRACVVVFVCLACCDMVCAALFVLVCVCVCVCARLSSESAPRIQSQRTGFNDGPMPPTRLQGQRMASQQRSITDTEALGAPSFKASTSRCTAARAYRPGMTGRCPWAFLPDLRAAWTLPSAFRRWPKPWRNHPPRVAVNTGLRPPMCYANAVSFHAKWLWCCHTISMRACEATFRPAGSRRQVVLEARILQHGHV